MAGGFPKERLDMDTTQIRAIITEHFRNTLKTLHRDGFVVGLSAASTAR